MKKSEGKKSEAKTLIADGAVRAKSELDIWAALFDGTAVIERTDAGNTVIHMPQAEFDKVTKGTT
jgi:hypothetical protein